VGDGGGSLIYDILTSRKPFVDGYTYTEYGSRHQKQSGACVYPTDTLEATLSLMPN